LGGDRAVKPPLNGNEGMEHVEVIVVIARAAIGFADDSRMEVRLRVMNTKKCRNEGIARYERTVMEIVKPEILVDAKYV
jgi:hypothetical protein